LTAPRISDKTSTPVAGVRPQPWRFRWLSHIQRTPSSSAATKSRSAASAGSAWSAARAPPRSPWSAARSAGLSPPSARTAPPRRRTPSRRRPVTLRPGAPKRYKDRPARSPRSRSRPRAPRPTSRPTPPSTWSRSRRTQPPDRRRSEHSSRVRSRPRSATFGRSRDAPGRRRFPIFSRGSFAARRAYASALRPTALWRAPA
jgi:hypothetical protein